MSKRGSGMRSSLSADDVGSSTKKPGKLSADFLAKFESADSAIGGSTGAIPKRLSHASSSEMGSTSASHEHLQSIKPHVKISEPPHRNEETVAGADNKNEKKRKSIWKWKPLKKMRRFFSRRKSSGRAKSFEDLRTESYRPKSTSDEHIEKRFSPVVRTRTLPANSKAPVVKELRQRHGSSSDDLSASSDTFASKTQSLPVLTSPGKLRDYESTEEAGVSFEDDPNSSSLEGLQAAHDKIKLAPKRRRPPSRKSGSVTSSLSADSPLHKEQKPSHRRSKTDPKDLTKDRLDVSLDSTSLSDVLNNTIFEEEESAKSPPVTVKEKVTDERKAAMDDIASRANEALARATERSKVAEKEVKDTVKKDEVDRTISTKSETGSSKYTEREVNKTNELPKTEAEVKKKSEQTKAEISGSQTFTEQEVKIPPRNSQDLPNRNKGSRTSLPKLDTTSPIMTSPIESEVKRESKRLSLDENMRKSFTESVFVSKSESDILRAEFTSLLQSEVADKLCNDDKTFGESSKENSHTKTTIQSETTQSKPPQVTPKPFKRGKSWSNNYTPKPIELPIKHDKEDTKKETINNNTPEKKSKSNDEESTTPVSEKKDFRFSRTKSWSYGMKPGDLKKANADGLNSKGSTEDTEGSSSDVQEAPSWVAKANRMSQRISQLIQDDGTSEENQTPTLPKTPVAKDSQTTKPNSPSNPVKENPQKPKPLTKKPLINEDKKPSPAAKPKPPSNFVRGSASLPRIVGNKANLETKTAPTPADRRSEATKKTIEPEKSVQQVARSSFGNVKIEKCIVCGTTVYQMEKCKFDDSVLHRNCIKCSICKRLLTVGNFVMTESKIYCKPHSRAVVAVST